jgi:hypothetical protein
MEQRYRSTLPAALGDLSGPTRGTVQLPLHVAWSGQTVFDLDRPKPQPVAGLADLDQQDGARSLGVSVPRTTRRTTSRAMNLNVLHRRLMQDVLEVGNSLPLVITGGYAV